MPACLRSQPSCHASLKFAGYSNLLNGDILKMSNLKLSQPGVIRLCLKDNAMFYKTLFKRNYKEIIAHLRDKHFECFIFNIVQHHQTFVNKETKRVCVTDIRTNKCFIKPCSTVEPGP